MCSLFYTLISYPFSFITRLSCTTQCYILESCYITRKRKKRKIKHLKTDIAVFQRNILFSNVCKRFARFPCLKTRSPKRTKSRVKHHYTRKRQLNPRQSLTLSSVTIRFSACTSTQTSTRLLDVRLWASFVDINLPSKTIGNTSFRSSNGHRWCRINCSARKGREKEIPSWCVSSLTPSNDHSFTVRENDPSPLSSPSSSSFFLPFFLLFFSFAPSSTRDHNSGSVNETFARGIPASRPNAMLEARV